MGAGTQIEHGPYERPRDREIASNGGGGGTQLAIVDKSGGLSGRSIADKSKYFKDGEVWDLTKICTALNADLGAKIGGKGACPFFHVHKNGCRFSATDCKFYH